MQLPVLSSALALVLLVGPAMAEAQPRRGHRVHFEIDPLPFARSGYGFQPGIRTKQLPELRVALGTFSLDVPDVVTELGGNDRFHTRVRRSHALYVLYYPQITDNGFCFGGSLRYLRLRYTHDDFPNQEALVGEFSFEAIAGYKWHPFDAGFYVQPWAALAFALGTRGDERIVGNVEYDPLPAQLFATVNIGWELEFGQSLEPKPEI